MSSKLKTTLSAIILLLLISGCSNPYSKYYHSLLPDENFVAENRIAPLPKEPRLITGTNVESDNIRMTEDGYVLIGVSNFNSGPINQKSAIGQAKKVYADTVIVYSQYTNTVSGSMPLTLPNTQTSYHSGSIYGSGGGYASYSGSSTTYGTSTSYIPYHVNRSDYYATFWFRAKPMSLGIHFDN